MTSASYEQPHTPRPADHAGDGPTDVGVERLSKVYAHAIIEAADRKQCRREVLEQQLDWTRLDRALKRLQQAKIRLTYPTRVTPFAFSLMVDKLRERVSSETLAQRITRMQKALENKAGK